MTRIALVSTLDHSIATEHTVSLPAYGTVDTIVARVAVVDRAVKVLGYTLAREGQAARAVSIAAVREYGYDVERLTAAIADGLRA